MRNVRTVAFIGLGIMGRPMAANLVKAGFDVAGYSAGGNPRRTCSPRVAGGAGSVAAAVRDAHAVITMLPDSPDVEAVALGPDGIVSSAPPGTLYIDMSSIRPEVARRVALTGAAHGLRCLDAPVSGGERGAIDGTLSVMAGGAAADVDAARPLLDAMGATILHVGPAGAGQTVKAANQLIVAGNIALVAEALVFLQAQGVDVAAAVAVLAGGLAGSTVLTRKAELDAGWRLHRRLPHGVARQGPGHLHRGGPRGPRRHAAGRDPGSADRRGVRAGRRQSRSLGTHACHPAALRPAAVNGPRTPARSRHAST